MTHASALRLTGTDQNPENTRAGEYLDLIAGYARELTHVTKHAIRTDNGIIFVDSVPLLVQLKVAVDPSGGRGGEGGTSGAVKILINSPALELLDEISAVSAEHLALVTQDHAVRGTTGERVRAWAANVTGADIREIAVTERIMRGWTERIRELLDPGTRVSLSGGCPVCGEDKVSTFDGADHLISDALYFTERTATCRVCCTTWPRADFIDLAAEIILSGDEVGLARARRAYADALDAEQAAAAA